MSNLFSSVEYSVCRIHDYPIDGNISNASLSVSE